MDFTFFLVYLFIYYSDLRTEVTSQAIRSSRTTDNIDILAQITDTLEIVWIS